jgi:hypothetical protein
MSEEKMEPYSDVRPESEYPGHQLIPQQGGRYTTVFNGPEGTDVKPLPCELADDGFGHVVNSSGWRPTDQQKAQLLAGAHIRLAMWTHPIPPVAVCVDPPVCRCHGDDMLFDTTDEGYYCAHTPTARREEKKSAFTQAKSDFTPQPLEGDDSQE